MRALDIEWLDSWGITEDNMGGDSLAMFVDGRADGKSMQDTLYRIGTEHVTNPADVLVLFSSINGASDEVMRKMQQVANIAKERNIEVLLAITHIDHVPEAEREQKRLVLMQYFGLKPEKVVLTKHERSGSRSCEVDKSTLDLFFRTMQAIQDSRINKLTIHLDYCRKAQDLECVAEIERLLNRQTSTTSVPPQKATASPTAKRADDGDSMVKEEAHKSEGFVQGARSDELHLLMTQWLPPVTVALATALVTTLGILLCRGKGSSKKQKKAKGKTKNAKSDKSDKNDEDEEEMEVDKNQDEPTDNAQKEKKEEEKKKGSNNEDGPYDQSTEDTQANEEDTNTEKDEEAKKNAHMNVKSTAGGIQPCTNNIPLICLDSSAGLEKKCVDNSS